MWCKEKILSKVSIDDEIRATLASGLVFRGRLISVDEDYDTITFVDGFEEHSICFDDIVSIGRVLKNVVAKNLLDTPEEHISGRDNKGDSN